MGGPIPEIEVTPGTEPTFSWSADAGDHGALIAGYKYGWDPADILNDDDWAVMLDSAFLSAPARICKPQHIATESMENGPPGNRTANILTWCQCVGREAGGIIPPWS
jgi:hypothetical protein